jgi:hypothetical protein
VPHYEITLEVAKKHGRGSVAKKHGRGSGDVSQRAWRVAAESFAHARHKAKSAAARYYEVIRTVNCRKLRQMRPMSHAIERRST